MDEFVDEGIVRLSLHRLDFRPLIQRVSYHKNSLRLGEKICALFKIMCSPARHKKVVATVNVPTLQPVVARFRKFPFKYLKNEYLALGLTTSQRAEAFCYHYNFCVDRIKHQALDAILSGGLFIWGYDDGERRHVMSLLLSETHVQKFRSGSHRINYQGEFSVHYTVNSTLVYLVSFTFVNQNIFGEEDETVVFVTRIQGVAESFDLLRQATKSLKDISPPFALVAALEGLCRALGIRTLIGLSRHQGQSESPYDRLFMALGANEMAHLATGLGSFAKYFRLPLAASKRPITEIKRTHRSRTNAKRRVRKHILDAVYDRTLKDIVSEVCLIATQPGNPNAAGPQHSAL